MKVVSNNYKNNIKTFGKEIAVKITYTINGTTTILENEDINSANFFYEGNLLKSVMKCLELDTNTNIPLNTILTYQFGVKVGNQYEYITLGDFIVKEAEKQEDTDSYYLTCYDKMLYAMTDYEDLGITYPISVRNYLSAICTKLGITFGSSSDNFVNYNQNITEEPYLDPNGNSLNYTFRDVLDELAQITASTICINDNNQLEVRYINTTNETLDEDSLKSINVNFGEKYVVDVEIDNQILNYMDRQTVLTNAYNEINGVEYYLNDFDSFGITYLELCDRYNVQVGNTTYSCIMLNDEINVRDGLSETIYTEEPKQNNSPYTYVNDTDKAVRSATITLDQKIGEVDIRGKAINLTADDISITSNNFSVDKYGVITATGANVSGTITSSNIVGGTISLTDAGDQASFNITSEDTTDTYETQILSLDILMNNKDIANYINRVASLGVQAVPRLSLFEQDTSAPQVVTTLRIIDVEPDKIEMLDNVNNKTTLIHSDSIYILDNVSNKATLIRTDQLSTPKIIAGNMDCGIVSITPRADTPTSKHVDFNKTFASIPIVVATPESAVIGSTVKGVSVANVTTTGFDVYIYRTNTTSTNINWIAMNM